MNSGRHNAMDISKDMECTQQSLLTALHKFVDAVDYMDETVMIPSRLRDMDVSPDEWITNASGKNGHIHSAPPSPTFLNVGSNKRRNSTEQQQQAIMPGNNVADEQNLYNFYNLLKAIKHEVVSGAPAESDVGHGIGGGGQLSSFEVEPGEDYNHIMPTMCSPPSLADEEDEVSAEEDTDSVISDTSSGTEDSRKVATSFRHHIRSLFDLLHQFTQTAKYLSNRYESEVGQSSASQVSSFAF